MITKEQALTTAGIHYDKGCRNSAFLFGAPLDPAKTCANWRRNGKTKTWKRDPERWEIPVKFGMYAYTRITNLDADLACYHTAEDCPYAY